MQGDVSHVRKVEEGHLGHVEVKLNSSSLNPLHGYF